MEGYNDLTTTHPEILQFWDYQKNNIFPHQVTHGSHKKVWWICEKGHHFESSVSRISGGGKCPFCTNQRVLKGYNDLQTVFPDILQYWDYEKNSIRPDEVCAYSNKKAWFTCSKDHSYNVLISSKTRGNYHSCPVCNTYKRTSVPEKIIVYYLKQKFDDIIENYKPDWLKPKEIDIYIPCLNLGIEYDGHKYHTDPCADIAKDELCTSYGISLVRIRELGCPYYESNAIFINIPVLYNNNFSHMNYALASLFDYLRIDVDIDINRDFSNIMTLVNVGNKENCLAYTDTELLKEWDFEKNNSMCITPESVTKGCGLKVWWVCDKGHSYRMSIGKRTLYKEGCPYCSNKLILRGFNDLATTHPELIKEWDYDSNKISPYEVSYGSTKQVYWICSKCNNKWKAIIGNRSKGVGCPYCSGRSVKLGYNDLETLNPNLVLEWHPIKNGALIPSNITAGSSKKIWWKCIECGHEWEATISNRVKGSGCPECAKPRKGPPKKSHEMFEKQLKNINANIQLISEYSGVKNKINCRCIFCGHEWFALPTNLLKGRGCSKCKK